MQNLKRKPTEVIAPIAAATPQYAPGKPGTRSNSEERDRSLNKITKPEAPKKIAEIFSVKMVIFAEI